MTAQRNRYSDPIEQKKQIGTEQLPQALDAENQLLAAVIIFGDRVLKQVDGIINANDFYKTANKIIFEAAKNLSHQGKSIDAVSLAHELKNYGNLEKAEWGYRIAKIMDEAPISMNPVAHAQIIKECSLKKTLYLIAARLVDDSGSNRSVDEILSRHSAELADLRSSAQSSVSNVSNTFSFEKLSSIELKATDWTVENLVEKEALTLFFGDPGVAKTFFAIDIICSISTGTPFHGHRVTQGPVLYIMGEGQRGIKRRFDAWSISRKIPLEDYPIYISTCPASLCDESGVRAVHSAIKSTGEAPEVIVVDTVGRNFGAGNENETRDMAYFIRGLDMIRAEFHCAIILIHHSGHKNKDRSKGSISLKGALDAEYRFVKDPSGTVRVENTKMKDHKKQLPLCYRLKSVRLRESGDETEEITSAVLESVQYCPTPTSMTSTTAMGKWQTSCSQILFDLAEEQHGNAESQSEVTVLIEDVRQEAINQGLAPKNWYRYQKFLCGLPEVQIDKEIFKINLSSTASRSKNAPPHHLTP